MVYKHMVPLNIKTTTQAPCVQGISHSMNSLSQTNISYSEQNIILITDRNVQRYLAP